MQSKIITWIIFYASTVVAAGTAYWFLGDLNANNWTPPWFAPPSWLFGPVWTTLYILIATSGYRIATAPQHGQSANALALWALQMCLNTLWTPVFFGAFDLIGAMAVILALWATIGAYVLVSYRIDRWASFLFLPYWAWVSFASILNYGYILAN